MKNKIITKKIIAPKIIENNIINDNTDLFCIACEKKLTNPNAKYYLGNNDYRHKTCGPSSRVWAEKFPSEISFMLYFHSINDMAVFEQYLKDRKYTEEKFFENKKMSQDFFKYYDSRSETQQVANSSTNKISKKNRMSVSGTFKNIRHLLEEIFATNKNITRTEVIKQVKIEFPDSKLVTEDKPVNYAWYTNFIIKKKEFKYISAPKWAK